MWIWNIIRSCNQYYETLTNITVLNLPFKTLHARMPAWAQVFSRHCTFIKSISKPTKIHISVNNRREMDLSDAEWPISMSEFVLFLKDKEQVKTSQQAKWTKGSHILEEVQEMEAWGKSCSSHQSFRDSKAGRMGMIKQDGKHDLCEMSISGIATAVWTITHPRM